MGAERTIYAKYHEKMLRLLKGCDMGSFAFVPDSVFDDFATYFVKTVEKEKSFKLYRYCGIRRYNKENQKEEFSFDLNTLFLGANGKQNDIFEGLPLSDYDIYSIDECIKKLSNVAWLKCFTETPRNNLMWSHYADSYKGICIEYDIQRASDEIKKMLFPVTYSKERRIYVSVDEIINYVKDESEEQFISDCKGIFLQKAYCWKYEREWRICKMTYGCAEPSILLEFPYISAIYLGPRINDADKQEILQLVNDSNNDNKDQIKVYTTKLCDDTYDVKFEDYC